VSAAQRDDGRFGGRRFDLRAGRVAASGFENDPDRMSEREGLVCFLLILQDVGLSPSSRAGLVLHGFPRLTPWAILCRPSGLQRMFTGENPLS